MAAQAHAQGWVAVAADSKGRWGYAFGERTSARAQAEALRGVRRTRMRYPGNSAGSLPRLCGEPCGRILVWRRPRSHAERGSLHGPAWMRAGSAGSNVPSREGDLRVTDRDIGPGSAPAPHIATYRHLRPNLAAATPQPGACPARPFELLTCPGATAATSGR